MLIPDRKTAKQRYDAALAAVRAAESGTDAAAYDAAEAALAVARSVLVAAELANPTKAEIKKRERSLYLRNRGIDD